ncbi:O-antigen ligase family protein [Kocuria sp. CPCC 205258]|uniref:O-antigen ligase family protein n=1 Tax=Kocuria sp. CPCC 205258 TaxID=3073552 RepID=UPI0034D61133
MKAAQLRFVIFVAMGMFVFQSESGWVSSLKFVYFPLVVLFGVISLGNLRYLDPSMKRALKPALVGLSILLVFITGVAFISIIRGEEPLRVFRDFFTYLLICIAPIVAVDAGRVTSLRSGKALAASFTGVAAVSFSVYWLSARGVSLLGVDRLLMFSMVLTGLGILLGSVYGLVRLRPTWVLFGILCFIAILVTGTRSGFILLLGVFGAVGAVRKFRIPVFRFAVGMIGIAVCTYLVLPVISSRVSKEGFLENRIRALGEIFGDGVTSDASGAIRSRAVDITRAEWRDRPLLGVGFGHAFESPVPGRVAVDFQLDSGMLLFAKFGVLGMLCLMVSFALIGFCIVRFHRAIGARSEAQALGTAFLFMCSLIAFLGAPTEDKGFAYGLSIVLFLLVVHGRAAHGMRASKLGTTVCTPRACLVSESVTR